MVEYDVLGNERHKAICKLRKLKCKSGLNGSFVCELASILNVPKDGAPYEDAVLHGLIRDRLIHLLGGDQPKFSELFGILREDDDGVDARPSDSASADSPVHGAVGCDCGGSCGCDGEELLAPITTELREYMETYRPFEDAGHVVVSRIGTIGFEGFDRLCDNIDAIHAGLERDYATACRVNERQDCEYADLAKRYDKTITLPLDADGVPIRVGDVVHLTESWRDLTVLGVGIVDAHERSYGVFVREGNDYVWYNADFLHHHDPTVEDVLAKFALACKDADNAGLEVARIIAEYAAKLKLADA